MPRSPPPPTSPHQGWLADATQGQHQVADMLLQQAYRWISNPAGPLYDAALHRAVAGLMQRLFLGLVVEMQRLGAQLVAADFHSITLNTRKRNLSAAGGPLVGCVTGAGAW